ncbi:hypothetical protein DL764_006473 [Monosporascus ibericus]|uniref:Uncharacterized protein n=1 Tax=Monosporascus ibericus TaxID=155417 RepID=A0A4Q4T4Q1_9PEZI|nr:hypothetical protein DL764_006473 [Monosporascus ibericus]
MVLTWLNNDLREGDESFVERNAITAIAFGVYNTGPVKVAVGPETARDGTLFLDLTTRGMLWAAIVSAVIFTTIQVQDLRDPECDRARGRRSAHCFSPLAMITLIRASGRLSTLRQQSMHDPMFSTRTSLSN